MVESGIKHHKPNQFFSAYMLDLQMKKYYSSGFFYITVTAMISFISQNEYKLSQEYQELRQQISNSDRTMSQNIRGIYLHKKFIFLPFNSPATRHWEDIMFYPSPFHTYAHPPFDFHPSSPPANDLKFIHKVMDHNRKAKVNFELYYFVYSGVMPLLTLAGRGGIHVLWTPSSLAQGYDPLY